MSFRVVLLSSSCQVPLLSLPVFFRHAGKLPFFSHSRRVSQPSSSFRASVARPGIHSSGGTVEPTGTTSLSAASCLDKPWGLWLVPSRFCGMDSRFRGNDGVLAITGKLEMAGTKAAVAAFAIRLPLSSFRASLPTFVIRLPLLSFPGVFSFFVMSGASFVTPGVFPSCREASFPPVMPRESPNLRHSGWFFLLRHSGRA